jgi:glycosyltransferase involved in cell wall biosynthesis
MDMRRGKISAFVVAYNRARILETCLRALRFADEIIVVDKSSTDDTRAVARRHATRVVTVPWTPTVEETRAFALSLCSYDWILFLDDDECLSPQAAPFLRAQVDQEESDVYEFPLRHYILGVHDETAYYWPEHHVRFFRRGAVDFSNTVHGGVHQLTEKVMRIPPEANVCIHHLSHPDVASWIERTNRYTSRPDRTRADDTGRDLAGFAHARIDQWLARSYDTTPNGYPEAVAVLRAVYDIVDRLKTWEEERGLDGNALFIQACERLDTAYGINPPRSMLERLRRRWHESKIRCAFVPNIHEALRWALRAQGARQRGVGETVRKT